jgi:hypothetical protein
MSTLPPPPPPQAPVAAAASGPRRRPPGLVIGGLVTIALVAGGATFLATRGDDNTTSPTTAPTTAPSQTRSLTSSPVSATLVITTPSTTATVESTAADTTPDTVVIPPGATELGYGVYVPVQANVTVDGDDPYTFTNTDTGIDTILQVLNRDAGEDPNVLLQEYIDTFDGDYPLMAYTVSEVFDPGHLGFPNLRLARVSYELYQEDQSKPNVGGAVYAVVRDDGLSIVGDVYGPPEDEMFTDETYRAMVGSLSNAPSVGETAAWFPATSVLPTSVHASVPLPFPTSRHLTLAPGYEVADQSASTITVSNGSDSLSFARLEGLVTDDDATAAAVQALQSGRSVGATDAFVADSGQTLPTLRANWSGTDTDGTAVTGNVWVVHDAAHGTAIVAIATHRTTQWDGNQIGVMIDSVWWSLKSID